MSIIQKQQNAKAYVQTKAFSKASCNYLLKLESELLALGKIREIEPDEAEAIATRIRTLTGKYLETIKPMKMPASLLDLKMDVEVVACRIDHVMSLVPSIMDYTRRGEINTALVTEYRDTLIEVSNLIESYQKKVKEMQE